VKACATVRAGATTIIYYDGKLIRKRQLDILLIEPFFEDGDVQELHSLSQNLSSQAATAALGCFITRKLNEPSCSNQFSNSKRFSNPSLSSTQPQSLRPK
jgi:hypothetical protein